MNRERTGGGRKSKYQRRVTSLFMGSFPFHRVLHCKEIKKTRSGLTGISLRVCPICQDGHMLVLEHLARAYGGSAILDSS